MIRAWIGVALLSVSWLLGLSYYHEACWLGRLVRSIFGLAEAPREFLIGWVVLVPAGTLLLMGSIRRMPGRLLSGIAAMLLLPAVWLAPWPYRAAPLLILVGLLIQLPPIPRDWPHRIGGAAVAAGVVLLAQALRMISYTAATARSHELPPPLPSLLGWVASLLGADVAVDGSTLSVWTMRRVHRLGATWELLFDPVTVCFVVGGVVLLALRAWARHPRTRRLKALGRALAGLVLPLLVWLPVRAGLLVALYVHRAMRTEYEAPLDLIGQFWDPWLHLLLLVPPVLLAWRFARLPAAQPAEPKSAPAWRGPAAAVLAGVAVALLTAGLFWDPVGTRKEGRVLVDEHHSDWEPTEKPYDTEWYGHDSGYNYACIYDYCSRFYDMGRLNEPITDATLAECDVLMLKCPDKLRYTTDEIDAIERFVNDGGGLLLVGEHTDVFGTGRNLNEVGRRFGVEFRYDCCFGVDSVFDDRQPPALVPHPIVQAMPPFEFAVSCSIAPRTLKGRSAIIGTGLKNLPADYHASNFYPPAVNRSDMRYGAFVQLWTARHGKGRVVAFGDSTVFSNFSTFEPGKPELMLGMLEWANHSGGVDPRLILWLLGLVAAGGAVFLAWRWDGGWVVLVAAGLLGWAFAAVEVREVHRAAMPLPEAVQPMTRVVIDRTVCSSHLPKSGFIGGKEGEFGIFERWILRLGYLTTRRRGDEAFMGDLLVFFHPDEQVSDAFRRGLVRYVEGGGKVLILDSPENAKSSANSLLWPFGLEVDRDRTVKGDLTVPEGWPSVPVQTAYAIKGGTPIARLGDVPVAAALRRGKGTVTVVGFGARFSDVRMGVTGDVEPGPDLRKVFDLQFALLRAIVQNTLDAPALPKE